MNQLNKKLLPKDGLAGLKENFTRDALSGFLVFLIAMPLSLGIAKASDFPPVMGLLTAIIGGVIVSLVAGSKLTIKGPAAGLIVICSGAVAAFGGGENGWKMALAAILVAGLLQIVFGFLRFGKLSDFFPAAAIHGMLAAIGLIIISKQVHTLLGIDPSLLKGKEPLELFAMIPESIAHANWHIEIIGLLGLSILFGLSAIKHPLVKKIPVPLLVLGIAIPLGILMNFKTDEPAYALVKVGSLFDKIGFNVDFSAITAHPGAFVQYVILFALIGSIESLLTVKAIDGLDPFKRKSDTNRDLVAVGLGNTLSAVLGGLPMISEVARSSANVANGARTRWANFFHGLFLLIFLIAAVPLIEMIPNAALAAMLIFVGFRLAHPREFIHTWHIGKEQFLIFISTLVLTLATDLLIGVFSGVLIKFIIHLVNGAGLRNMFRSDFEVLQPDGRTYIVRIKGSAVFTNLLGLKKALMEIPVEGDVTVDFSRVKMVDHTTLKTIQTIKDDVEAEGGSFSILGLEGMKAMSAEPTATRISVLN
ncbi:MAG: SulP family inorganic anion transporter [Bacteroidetes bacterium]|nr:SulP family inorganic anion transporter [Bacteroidota bacterium]